MGLLLILNDILSSPSHFYSFSCSFRRFLLQLSTMLQRQKVTVIKGDGIGPEIMDSTLAVLEASGALLSFEEASAGMDAFLRFNNPLPDTTLASIESTRIALKGPLTTPKGGGFRSINVALRQQFDLYVNLRPAKTILGVPSRYKDVDTVIVRENTEDLYAGIEHYIGPNKSAAESIAIITRYASERIIRYAFDYARQHGRKKVTLVHKANILKMSSGLFLEVGQELSKQYSDILFDEIIVDAACMKLVLAPEKFDVIVTTNMFGDIISDLVSGLVGGLGVAPGANLGEKTAIFEAVHGSAPDIAGQGIANPTALIMASTMMLDHLGQTAPAEKIRKAIYLILQNQSLRTKDLGGAASTQEFTKNLIDHIKLL